ncbi:MAG TPA: hypothetical protein VJ327_02005 [Patescibacteria group bacterium]|nr:hypothetical protein [Patescibacteria group bacterium]
MKTYLGPILVLAVLLLLPASSAMNAGFVDLPPQVETGITAVIVFGVSWLFVQLINLISWLAFLEQFKMPLALAISAQLIAWIEQLVPDAYGGVAITGIVFLLAILALFGVGEQLRKMNAPGFRARS